MTVYGLIQRYYEHNPNGHYFDSDTLRFFGERISEMRVLKDTVKIKSAGGEEHECYCLSKRSRKYPGGPRRTYAYFDITTFEDVIV